jgi:hypothetical protein
VPGDDKAIVGAVDIVGPANARVTMTGFVLPGSVTIHRAEVSEGESDHSRQLLVAGRRDYPGV